MIIGPGITIGGGIGVDSQVAAGGGGNMRSLLSASGQTAYDAAVSDNWFEVSSTDYDAVFSGLSGMSKVGMTDAQMNETGSSWTVNYLTTVSQASATVASGSYIIGARCKFSGAGTNTAKIYTGTTFKGAYTQLANNMTASGAGFKYFLRKTPSAQGATTYIGILGAGTANLVGGTTNWSGGGYSTSPFSSWTVYNFTFPVFQTLVTTTQQW